jgi:hypothetical protein
VQIVKIEIRNNLGCHVLFKKIIYRYVIVAAAINIFEIKPVSENK